MKYFLCELDQRIVENLAIFCMCSTEAVVYTCNFINKDTLAQVFSPEFCEISKNTFSYRTPPVAGSDSTVCRDGEYLMWRRN